MTSGLSALNSMAINSPSKMRLSSRLDHTARLKTRWYLPNCFSSASPMTRKAAVTVRFSGDKMAPTTKSTACGQTRSENIGANCSSTGTISVKGRGNTARLRR